MRRAASSLRSRRTRTAWEMNQAFATRQHFAFETNFHTHDILPYLDLADKHGYKKDLVFLGLDSPGLAQKRVRHRVNTGGHFVPDDEILSRYKKGLILLYVVDRCDLWWRRLVPHSIFRLLWRISNVLNVVKKLLPWPPDVRGAATGSSNRG